MEPRFAAEQPSKQEKTFAEARQETLACLKKAARRSSVFAALLLATNVASLEGCASGLKVGSGALADVRPEAHPKFADTEKLPSYGEMLQELQEAVGRERVETDIEMQQQYVRHAGEYEAIPLQVSGFEHLDISNALPKKLVEETIPRSWWAKGHLSKMEINPHPIPMQYPGLEKSFEYAHCRPYSNGSPVEIEFTSGSLQPIETRNALDDTALLNLFAVDLHELAHAADWSKSPVLKPDQVLTEMYLTYRLTVDPGSPTWSYPSSIQTKKNEERQIVEYGKMVESFAELMRDGLSEVAGEDWQTWEDALISSLVERRAATRSGAKKAAELVRLHLQWSDPLFKPWEAAKNRVELVDKMYVEQNVQRFSRILEEEIPDTQISQELRREFQQLSWSKDDVLYQIAMQTGTDETPEHKFAGVDSSKYWSTEVDHKLIDSGFYFDGVLRTFLSIRANRLDYRRREGERFGVWYGDSAIKKFKQSLNQLSATEKAAFRTIAFKNMEILSLKAPTSK